MIICTNSRGYAIGETVMALTYFSPEFHVGSIGKILTRANGRLLAIRTPSGEIFKWLTIFELVPADPENHLLFEGTYAYLANDRFGQEKGTLVQIVKRIGEIDYYQVAANDRQEIYRVTGIDITNQL